MTTQEFEESLRVVLAAYHDAAEAGMGIDYEALSHAVATSGTAAVPTVSSATMRRLHARAWLEEAARVVAAALHSPRQRLQYVELVLGAVQPRTPQEHALMKFARSMVCGQLKQSRLTTWHS